MYVVYCNPKDFPNKYVCRRFEINNQPIPQEIVGEDDTLEEIRQKIPSYCSRIDRHPNDEPQIVEVWF